jgi:hypothetical protein
MSLEYTYLLSYYQVSKKGNITLIFSRVSEVIKRTHQNASKLYIFDKLYQMNPICTQRNKLEINDL